MPARALRLASSTALAATALAVLTALAGPARAAGTGDVELVPATAGGQPATSFFVAPDQDALRFDLVNLVDAPRTARLYAASATRSAGGGVSVGADGSASWLRLPDAEVRLAPKQVRTITVPLQLADLPADRQVLGAVVLEAVQGSVTVRVATLVTVAPHPARPLPPGAVALAAGAILLAVALLVLLARRRRRA